MTTHLANDLYQKILAGDMRSATALVEEWANTHGYDRAVTEILEPALDLFGEKWSTSEDFSLAQGYVAGKVAENIMTKAIESLSADSSRTVSKGTIVIGNIEDDHHALGRKLVSIFLRNAGWEICNLGNDVLPVEFVDKAEEVNASIIAVSAMMYTTAMNIKKLREEIDNRELNGRILLAVGGAVFLQRPELVEIVGGDGTALNAIKAPILMDQLLERSVSKGGVS